MLQYITNTQSEIPVIDQVFAVLEGGCRWIQVRMKEASDDEIARVVEAIKPKCLEIGAFLLLDDRVELCKTLDVGGVHLGKDDMPPSQARVKLGPAAVIGVTANTPQDIIAVQALDIDYFGFGPFADTRTKANLAPILGLAGLKHLVATLKERGIEIPAVAVGGIKLDDVKSVMQTGVNGIAVSGAIANAKDPIAETRRFIDALGHY